MRRLFLFFQIFCAGSALAENPALFVDKFTEERICRPLRQNPEISGQARHGLLEEVLSSYISLMAVTQDHDPFHCLYRYFASLNHPGLTDLLQKASPENREDILRRLKLCEREVRCGNGSFLAGRGSDVSAPCGEDSAVFRQAGAPAQAPEHAGGLNQQSAIEEKPIRPPEYAGVFHHFTGRAASHLLSPVVFTQQDLDSKRWSGQALDEGRGGFDRHGNSHFMAEELPQEETTRDKAFYLNESEAVEEDKNPFLRFFMDTVYENASCHCKAGDRCSRGCAKPPLSQPESPAMPCSGEKNPARSKSLCMRYVNGALMRTFSHFSDFVCNRDEKKCEDENHSLCSQSFVFPHGFCGLSLVGAEWLSHIPDSPTPPEGKEGNFVRRECLDWKSHNKHLHRISLKNEAGETEDIPLFVEIETTEETLMEDLPAGAIIVGFRQSPSGHIEVKTDKKECYNGGELQSGEGKTCFCSDFCRNMEGPFFSHYISRPRKVIQWNPRFVEIINSRWREGREDRENRESFYFYTDPI